MIPIELLGVIISQLEKCNRINSLPMAFAGSERATGEICHLDATRSDCAQSQTSDGDTNWARLSGWPLVSFVKFIHVWDRIRLIEINAAQ